MEMSDEHDAVSRPNALPAIPAQTFTPLLGSLLLSANTNVGDAARWGVVELLARIQGRVRVDGEIEWRDVLGTDGRPKVWEGLFGAEQRTLMEQELVLGVVVGIARLDGAGEDLEANSYHGFAQPAVDLLPGEVISAGQPATDISGCKGDHSAWPEDVSYQGISTSHGDDHDNSASPWPSSSSVSQHSTASTSAASQVPSPSSSVDSTSSTPPLSSGGDSPADPPPRVPTPPLNGPASSLISHGPPLSDAPPILDAPSYASTVIQLFSTSETHQPTSSYETSEVVSRDDISGVSSGSYAGGSTKSAEANWPPGFGSDSEASSNSYAAVPSGPSSETSTALDDSSALAWHVPQNGADWMTDEDGAPIELDMTDLNYEGDMNEEAAVGRVASMSLIAAVTASGSLSEENQNIFVQEVERVGRDSVYWVRREAAYALGALAKVVPLEVVTSSLLPLYESFSTDNVWHVRHSALFALPGLLSRLTAVHRRTLAKTQISRLMMDSSRSVRSGLLEVLGEIIYTFREDIDEGGPPEELIGLFVGRTGDRTDQSSRSTAPSVGYHSLSLAAGVTLFYTNHETEPEGSEGNHQRISPEGSPLDPDRSLICAFNFPAVVSTLGSARWSELRDYYLRLAHDNASKVRRTLAASLGEMARIIGHINARQDLLPIWEDSIRSEEAEVRMKAIGCLDTFLGALAPDDRGVITSQLETLWQENLRGWREREALAGILGSLVGLLGEHGHLLGSLMRRALLDNVAAVREAAISAVPTFISSLSCYPEVHRTVRLDLLALATAESYRKRATYIACCQALVLSKHGDEEIRRTSLWDSLLVLAVDPIIDVRIGVARLIGVICMKQYHDQVSRHSFIANIISTLSKDGSDEVRSFVSHHLDYKPYTFIAEPTTSASALATFSRPPPTPLASELRTSPAANHHDTRDSTSEEHAQDPPIDNTVQEMFDFHHSNVVNSETMHSFQFGRISPLNNTSVTSTPSDDIRDDPFAAYVTPGRSAKSEPDRFDFFLP
ncbi:hypothetical protein BOTBODRAFT_33728 [Botryobasidium botryosum FD-172 SS1]|uniref:TOG domain-containing protein n=1 Tax=Botryobasidium botryosum (strain FD-172 SS1) TaxID=930990 RepID=A0A067MEI2_BOTB1|nr:hypothetical protein BOTBODRAFT_33728 [Botryobasidium botryosum FD-172 SS1]